LEVPVRPPTGVYTTKRIMKNEEPITYVCHDLHDGAWQFHGPSDSPPGSATLVCFHHIVDNDRSIGELSGLPVFGELGGIHSMVLGVAGRRKLKRNNVSPALWRSMLRHYNGEMSRFLR
jgi:hypothetical protein